MHTLARARSLSLSLSASLSQAFWAAAKELPDGCYTQVKVGDKIANIFFSSYIRYVRDVTSSMLLSCDESASSHTRARAQESA